MKASNKTLSKELIDNTKKLGLIQVSEYEFKYSMKSDFIIDLSATASDENSILKSISYQAVCQRDSYMDKFNSLVIDSLNNHNSNYEMFQRSQQMNERLVNKNKSLTDYLIGLSNNKEIPTLNDIRKLIES